MTEPSSPKSPRTGAPEPRTPQKLAGGMPIALLTIAGVIAGGFMGQPTIGLLVGLGIGIAIAIALWRMGPR